ncbi:MAG TPA: epoxide hydrolase N-terminal domain-containing protein, partial [Polyangiales bacterium]
MSAPTPRPFRLAVPEPVLLDLQRRLREARWPDAPPDADPRQGASLALVRALVEHWRERFSFRQAEAELNAL